MATKADIRNDVLKHIQVLAAGESASSEDAADVENIIDGHLEQLAQDGIAYWGADDYPDHIRRPFVRLVAADAAVQFNVSLQERQKFDQDAAAAYRELVSQTAVRDEFGLPVKGEYF